jgi:hypothetical protein
MYNYILNHSLCQWFYPLLWQYQHLTQAQYLILIYRFVTRTVIITYIDTNGNESESVTTSLSDVLYRGFVINGEVAGDQSGYSVSSAGDVNGDGLDDLIVGAWRAEKVPEVLLMIKVLEACV